MLLLIMLKGEMSMVNFKYTMASVRSFTPFIFVRLCRCCLKSGRRDLNPRLPHPKCGTLPS